MFLGIIARLHLCVFLFPAGRPASAPLPGSGWYPGSPRRRPRPGVYPELSSPLFPGRCEMAYVEGPLGTGCEQHLSGSTICFYFRVSANEKRKKKQHNLKPSNVLPDFNSWRRLCSTMTVLLAAKAASYHVWSGSNVFQGDLSAGLFWWMIAKEFHLTTVTVDFPFSGLSEKKKKRKKKHPNCEALHIFRPRLPLPARFPSCCF